MSRFVPKPMVIKAYDNTNVGTGGPGEYQVAPMRKGTQGTLYVSINKANSEAISPGLGTVINEPQDNDYGKTVQKVSKKSKSRFRRKS